MGEREPGAERRLPELEEEELEWGCNGGRSCASAALRSMTGDGRAGRAFGRVEKGICIGRGRLAEEVRSTAGDGGSFFAGDRPW